MHFSNISIPELAKLFVYSKKEKIEKLLCVNNLDTYTAAEILNDFIVEHMNDFWKSNHNKYNLLFDDMFFFAAINELQNKQKNGTSLDGGSAFCEPNVAYIS